MGHFCDKMLKVNIITTLHGIDIQKTKKQCCGNDDNHIDISNDGGEGPNDDYHELQPQILTL
jgi:nitrous oxide reductase